MRLKTAMAQARVDRGLTQAELADRVGLGQGRLSEYETARRFLLPSSRAASELSRVLHLPARALQDPIPPAGSPSVEAMRKALGADIAEKLVELYGGMRLPTIAQMEVALAARGERRSSNQRDRRK